MKANPLYALLSFKKMHWFLPVLIFVLYVPQSLIGVMFFHPFIGDTGWLFVVMLLLSLSVYVGTYTFIGRREVGVRLDRYAIEVNSGAVIRFIVIPYVLMYSYVLFTTEAVPLWEAIHGACASDLAIYREGLFRTRVGVEAIFNYVNSIFTVLLMPYAMLVLYLSRHKFRHWILGIFVFSLLISLEKSLILRAALPLLILVANGYSNRLGYSVGKIAVVIVVVIVVVAAISKGQLADRNCSPELGSVVDVVETVDETIGGGKFAEKSPHLKKYFPLGYDDPITFLVNRVVWIPYITAIDTLNYSRDRLSGRLLLGSSSGVVSFFTARERVHLEREVFSYEWGQNSTGTGSANAVYISDAFVNFGWAGIIIGSMLLALITHIFQATTNIVAKSIYYTYAILLSMGSIFGVLFSGGLVLALLIAMFVKHESSLENN